MSKTNSHLFLAFLIALLAVFLFVGSVSADDGSSTPAPAATSAAAVTDEATQVPQVTATEEATQVTTPAATATATPDDSAAGVTEPPATEESPTADVSAQQTATPEPTVLTETETAAEATATATLAPTAASDSDAATAEATAAASTSTGGDPYFMVGVHKYAFVSDGEDCPDQGSANTTCIVTSTSDPTKSTNVIKTAIQYIADNGLIPTDKKIYIL